jgi:3-phenylpropionate/cinnamic acid dioxygenase small subunit
MAEPDAAAAMLDLETTVAVERFLSLEARLLDEERYDDWLLLLAPDIRYLMPIPKNLFRRNRAGASSLGEGFIYDENFDRLRQRVEREKTGMVWLNDPPTRHIRIITNIEAVPGDAAGTLAVRSKFMLFRSRRDHDRVSHVGRREDVLRMDDGHFRIVRRVVHLLDRVITDKNLNMFF